MKNVSQGNNYVSIINTDNITKNNNKLKQTNSFIYAFSLIILLLIFIFIYIFKYGKYLSKQVIDIKNFQNEKKSMTFSKHQIENEQFNEFINNKYKSYQDFFCQNEMIFNNTLIQEKLKIVKAHINNIYFDMFVYKRNGFVSTSISSSGSYEFNETKSILSSLLYYSDKKNISKSDIYVLDIGANIGWYSLTLGNEGYNIISFEPSKINYYILLKNYCLNKDINLTIINKGLDKVDKKFFLYHPLNDIGNGVAFEGQDLLNLTNPLKEEISITTLKYYLDYLKTKHLVCIKLDVEGSEGKVIEGGLDLIIKYHVPFIFMEWTPDYLKLKGTDLKLFLEMFENNGYKFSKTDFLSKNYITLDYLLNNGRKNIYFVYEKFLN